MKCDAGGRISREYLERQKERTNLLLEHRLLAVVFIERILKCFFGFFFLTYYMVEVTVNIGRRITSKADGRRGQNRQIRFRMRDQATIQSEGQL